MTQEKILVIEKDGISYIKIGYNRNYLINGNPLNFCPGNNDWAMIEGKVERIDRTWKPPAKAVGFKLKSDYEGMVVGLLKELPLSAFNYDEENYSYIGKNREFYGIVYDDPQPLHEILPFEVLDTDCKPEKVPLYVVFDFPYDLKYNREVQHKYPCHIPLHEVFNLIWDKIAEKIKDNPTKYTMDNYKSIQTLTVKEIIEIPWGERRTVEFYPSIRSKKAKKEVREYHSKEIQILNIVGKYERKYDAIKVQEVKGKDYYDLMKNLEEYIQSILSIFDDKRREVCPACKGVGIIIK